MITNKKMKRLILFIIILVTTTNLFAQTTARTSTTKIMTLCGVAFGQENSKFVEQLKNSEKYTNLQTLLSDNGRIDDVHITTTYYDRMLDTDIVYCAALCLKARFNGYMGRPYMLLKSILSSKFGNYETSCTYEGKDCLCWNLPYGQITMWVESGTELIVFFMDYAALKKAHKVLDDAF